MRIKLDYKYTLIIRFRQLSAEQGPPADALGAPPAKMAEMEAEVEKNLATLALLIVGLRFLQHEEQNEVLINEYMKLQLMERNRR